MAHQLTQEVMKQESATGAVEKAAEESLEGMPAFVRSWRQVYIFLLLFLVLLVVLFGWFSEVWR